MDLHPAAGTYPITDLITSGLARVVGGNALLVHAVLWDIQRQYSECRPSHHEIKRRTGLSKETVGRCIQTLAQHGLIRVSKRGMKSIFHLQWTGLPDVSLPPKTAGPSPYKKSSETQSYLDETTHQLVTEPVSHSYASTDGHRRNSRAETMVDDHLASLGIPHWGNVPYSDIFPEHRGKETVDWLLAPKLVIEYYGTLDAKYVKQRTKKEAILAKHGWTLVALNEEDTTNLGKKINLALRDQVKSAYETATQADLEFLWNLKSVRMDQSRWTSNLAERLDRRSQAQASSTTPDSPAVVGDASLESHGPSPWLLKQRFPSLSEEEARGYVRALAKLHRTSSRLLSQCDTALVDAVMTASALPATARRAITGILMLQIADLHDTAAWAAEVVPVAATALPSTRSTATPPAMVPGQDRSTEQSPALPSWTGNDADDTDDRDDNPGLYRDLDADDEGKEGDGN